MSTLRILARIAPGFVALALAPAPAAAQAPGAIDVPAAEGHPVHVELSAAAGGSKPDLAAAYVGYLDSLPHGSELRRLTAQVGSTDQVAGLCGGLDSRASSPATAPGTDA